jgi:hypothetical protein
MRASRPAGAQTRHDAWCWSKVRHLSAVKFLISGLTEGHDISQEQKSIGPGRKPFRTRLRRASC